MEQLLEDVPPPRDRVFDDLGKELRDGLICPVLLGSAETSHGIFRLLKALRHEAPFVQSTAKRIGVDKTIHAPWWSRLSTPPMAASCGSPACCRGNFADGTTVYGGAEEERISGIFSVMGQEPVKRGEAKPGDTVAFGGSTRQDRRQFERGEGPGEEGHNAGPAKPVFGTRHRRERKEGRGEAHRGHRQDHRGGSLDLATMRKTWARWCCGAKARCIYGSRSRSSCEIRHRRFDPFATDPL